MSLIFNVLFVAIYFVGVARVAGEWPLPVVAALVVFGLPCAGVGALALSLAVEDLAAGDFDNAAVAAETMLAAMMPPVGTLALMI